jgi:hypothetical protein
MIELSSAWGRPAAGMFLCGEHLERVRNQAFQQKWIFLYCLCTATILKVMWCGIQGTHESKS